jgi:RHS repeat-associated protein
LVSILVKWPATYTWTSYNQPYSLSASGSSSQFFYDHNHQRWKQIASYSGATETTEYIGGLLEKMTNSSGTAYRYYVSAGNNLIVYNRWVSGNNAVYYVTKDHIGSSAVITDLNGALVVSEKFAALGWNENTSTQQATIASVTRHGFTGQEGLDNLGMVNMNGRVYVPSGSMFISPDPHTNDPSNTLSYNRYAYVNYNPLRYSAATTPFATTALSIARSACGG